MAEVILTERQHAFGQKFIQFIVRKVVDEKYYKSQIMRLLAVLASNAPNIKTYTLSQLVKDGTFRHRIYLQ